MQGHVEVILADRLLAELVEARAAALGLEVGAGSAGPRRVVRGETPYATSPGDTEVVIADLADAEALDHCSRRTVVAVLLARSPAALLDLALTITDRQAGLVLDPAVAARLAARVDRRGTSTGGAALTARETQIVASMRAGHSLKQIAAGLGLTAKTVENHATKLYAKLGATNRREAVARAHELGLTEAGG